MSTALIFCLLALKVQDDTSRAFMESVRPDLAEAHRYLSRGGASYLLFEEAGHNRTFDWNDKIARSWSLMGMGDFSDVIRQALRFAGDFEGGNARFANARSTKPEAFIAAVRKSLTEAVTLHPAGIHHSLSLLLDHRLVEGDADPQLGSLVGAFGRQGYLKHLVETGGIRKGATRRVPASVGSETGMRFTWVDEPDPDHLVDIPVSKLGAASAVVTALAAVWGSNRPMLRLHDPAYQWEAFLNHVWHCRVAA